MGRKIPILPCGPVKIIRARWGPLDLPFQYQRRVRFFAITIQECFEFRPRWYREGAIVPALVLAYYALLRSILRTRSELRRCLARCRHCRIFFIAHPRNAGRCDLRCPFGCREAQRRRRSTQRSVEYYRGTEGRRKKRQQNSQRRAAAPAVAAKVVAAVPLPNVEIVEHVRMVVSLIEGRPVSRAAIEAMLKKVLRQHRMPKRGKIGDSVVRSDEHPP